MQELIKITQDAQGINTVNARDMHSFLEVGRDFSNWIKERIESFGFTENQDFVCSTNPANGNGAGLRGRIDYHLTLDMAKELSMVERNAKGKEARQYFIEVEKAARAVPTDPLLAQIQCLLTLRQNQIAQEARLSVIESKMITRDESYFTLAGYCNLKGVKLDRAGMIMVAKAAAKHSRENGYNIGAVYDSRYGTVNEYHSESLRFAMDAKE